MAKIRLVPMVSCAAAVAICLFSSNIFADIRTEYLVNMLEKGGGYRVRVQAATTLGKIRAQEAVPALVRSLEDTNDLVVISAVVALGQIGDLSAIPSIEKAKTRVSSSAAKSQIESTLRMLRALLAEEGDTASVTIRPAFLVRIDTMGNSSGVKRSDITDILRDEIVKRVGKEPGVLLQISGLEAKEVREKLKKEKLSGYILSGSILRMEHVADQMIVKIGLNVFTNPDYSLLMMPTAEGAVSVMAGPMTREAEQDAQDRALKAVVGSLVGGVFDALRKMN